ncbi:hypothetical protein RJ639_047671 [Escallonia herrerae]|uniref:E3 SUMO-protein ligase SIZ1 n=1 Tax=Escallonia herrerae TaxID=1293975 RepID=A0AA89B5M2_9ASTE|nr:hypothetical protein RJ639_047671 [Escallonia herrerae]
MDLVASCKDKLAYFRIKELKDVLTQLGLSKQGKKQDLVDRILAILSDERGATVSGTIDLASKGQGVSDCSNVKLKEENEESYQIDKVRCPCGSSLQSDSVIKGQCEGRRCTVWQHIGCVIIPEKHSDGVLPSPPEVFYCEICRLSRADPFWATVANPLYPVKLTTTNVPTDGGNPVQSVEKTFQLTRADKDLLAKPDHDMQAWCILLNDKVPFRMQWPQYADLQVNGVPVRAINRPGSQLLGANGRDDGPIVTSCTRDGVNKISLTGCDSRVFCLGVRIVKRRTVQHILSLIPKESEGELFEDALARVRRCVGGGTATENADSDSDLEIVADSIPVNLRCPMSGSRMKVAGRFKHCVHMGCFDLDVFVEMNQRSRKASNYPHAFVWQCPICLKNYSLENIIIDPYFNRITSKMHNCGEDLTEIEVKPDGSWRAKAEGDCRSLGDLGQWHLPDGSLCVPMDRGAKLESEVLKQVKQECVSEGHTGLRLGIKKNRNGFWEVSKPEDMHTLSSGNKLQENFENHGNNVIPMSSSATGSGGEDPSVNQDGGNFDFSTNNGVELDSLSLNIEPSFEFINGNASVALGDANVIVLSDSDDEVEALISSEPIYKDSRPDAAGVSYAVPPNGIPDPYHEDPALGAGGSCLGLFHTNDDEFGVPPLWSLPSSTQGGPGFQLFGSDADVSDALVDAQHGSLNCPMNGYLTGETAMGSALVPDSSFQHSSADINDGLVDNPLAFGGDDPSLHLFLPTRPTDTAVQVDMGDQRDTSNGIRTEDWISLTLGGGGGGGSHGESAAANGLSSRQQVPAKEGALDSLAEASLLLGMNDHRSSKTTRERSDSPFSFPRQRRSVRPRMYLSIDSDSE